MDNLEEIEEKFLELVKEQHRRSGVANGIDLFHINLELKTDIEKLKTVRDKLLTEQKIVKINHLNGVSYTLPK